MNIDRGGKGKGRLFKRKGRGRERLQDRQGRKGKKGKRINYRRRGRGLGGRL